MFCSKSTKMNNVINKFLLAGDRFIPEMHLRQPAFTYSAWGLFNKNQQQKQNKTKTQKSKEK